MDEHDQGAEDEVQSHSRQKQRKRRQRIPRSRDEKHQQDRQKCAHKRGQRHEGNAQNHCPQPEPDRDHGAKGTACRDPEREWSRKRVSQNGLKQNARNRQGAAGNRSKENPGQSCDEEDLAIGADAGNDVSPGHRGRADPWRDQQHDGAK